MGKAWVGRRNVISAEAMGGLGAFLWKRWMQKIASSTDAIKENSTAATTTMRQNSSHSSSVGRVGIEGGSPSKGFPNSSWSCPGS